MATILYFLMISYHITWLPPDVLISLFMYISRRWWSNTRYPISSSSKFCQISWFNIYLNFKSLFNDTCIYFTRYVTVNLVIVIWTPDKQRELYYKHVDFRIMSDFNSVWWSVSSLDQVTAVIGYYHWWR